MPQRMSKPHLLEVPSWHPWRTWLYVCMYVFRPGLLLHLRANCDLRKTRTGGKGHEVVVDRVYIRKARKRNPATANLSGWHIKLRTEQAFCCCNSQNTPARKEWRAGHTKMAWYSSATRLREHNGQRRWLRGTETRLREAIVYSTRHARFKCVACSVFQPAHRKFVITRSRAVVAEHTLKVVRLQHSGLPCKRAFNMKMQEIPAFHTPS
jgi:hypothetical protein